MTVAYVNPLTFGTGRSGRPLIRKRPGARSFLIRAPPILTPPRLARQNCDSIATVPTKWRGQKMAMHSLTRFCLHSLTDLGRGRAASGVQYAFDQPCRSI